MLTLKEYMSAFNISRSNMPQINDVVDFKRYMISNGVDVAFEGYIEPSELKMTQQEYDVNKVNKLISTSSISSSIIVSSDSFALDGHHRFLAHLIADKPIHIIKFNTTINNLLRHAYEYTSKDSENQ